MIVIPPIPCTGFVILLPGRSAAVGHGKYSIKRMDRAWTNFVGDPFPHKIIQILCCCCCMFLHFWRKLYCKVFIKTYGKHTSLGRLPDIAGRNTSSADVLIVLLQNITTKFNEHMQNNYDLLEARPTDGHLEGVSSLNHKLHITFAMYNCHCSALKTALQAQLYINHEVK